MRRGRWIGGILGGALLGAPAASQGLTEAEIAERFRAQMAAMAGSRDPLRSVEIVEAEEGGGPAGPVEVFGEDLQVNLRISFGFDSAVIPPSQLGDLQTVCRAIWTSEIGRFRIIGHTDGSGPEAYNQRLSELRAQEVARYLTGDCGIDPGRLDVLGVGEAYPLDGENPRADVNRRVEFQVSGEG